MSAWVFLPQSSLFICSYSLSLPINFPLRTLRSAPMVGMVALIRVCFEIPSLLHQSGKKALQVNIVGSQLFTLGA